MATRWLGIWLVALSGLSWAQDDEKDGDSGIDVGEAKAQETSFPKRKPGEKRAKVVVESKDKVYRLRLPDDWVVVEVAPDDKDTRLAFDLTLPGSKMSSRLELVRQEDSWDPRGIPFLSTGEEGDRIDRHVSPVPHIVIRDEDTARVHAFLRRRGNPLELRLRCGVTDFDEGAHKDLVDAAASLTAELAAWPPLPAGYKMQRSGRYLFAVHPTVTNPGAVKRILLAQERWFVKRHGRLPKAAYGWPVVVFVHHKMEQAAGLYWEAVGKTNRSLFDPRTYRLFTLPVRAKDDVHAGTLAITAQALCYMLKYGHHLPAWTTAGERIVAHLEVVTRKPLPYFDVDSRDWLGGVTIKRLDELDEKLRTSQWREYEKQAFWYVALFHAGPRQYRKAYKSFLEELARTHDPVAAQKHHIDPLDVEALKEAAQRFADAGVKYCVPKGN
jgi:hypothetical protein